MLNRERRRPSWHYNEPRALRRRAWWALGYDPLTMRQRLHQVRAESDWWKCRALDCEATLLELGDVHAAREAVPGFTGGDPATLTERANDLEVPR